MRVWDRGYLGSGHGWAGNTVVFWNCLSSAARNGSVGFRVSSPAYGANYCVGCVAEGSDDGDDYEQDGPWCCGSPGLYESSGEHVNEIPSLYAAQKEERDRLRKRAEEIKQASWKYGLGSAGVFIGGMCLYSLLTISRSTITTVALDDAVLLKEVSSDCVVSACMAS